MTSDHRSGRTSDGKESTFSFLVVGKLAANVIASLPIHIERNRRISMRRCGVDINVFSPFDQRAVTIYGLGHAHISICGRAAQ